MTDSDCSPTTRYLAKIYMDLYIKAHPNEGFQTYKEVAFISMYMAVKVEALLFSSTRISSTLPLNKNWVFPNNTLPWWR